jgi:F-type H+-transporting ATPase subunit b
VLIDWFTVLAQIINFLILVFLLRYFLYEPILAAMAEREARIAADLAAAEQKRAEAAQEIVTYQEKNRELEAQREEWLQQARQEVETWQKEKTRQARQEVDEARERWYEALRQEKDGFLQDLRRRVGHQIYTIIRRALADLTGEELEQRLVEQFLRRLEAVDGQVRRQIREALDQPERELVISSAHELPAETRRRLATAVQTLYPSGPANGIRFVTDPALIGGLELRIEGYKIAWSLADYLESLEEELLEVMRL